MDTFQACLPDYASWIDHALIRPECEQEVDETARHLVSVLDHFKAGCDATNVPLVWAAPSFQRESSCDFRCSPAQGDRWDRRSVDVPAGLGPYGSFTEAQIAAYKIDGIEKYAGRWSLELALYLWEKFNGFGYRDKWRIPTPYDVAGTTVQQKGKYIADGKFTYGVMDSQLGCLAMYLGMVRIDASLALPRAIPAAAGAAPIIVPTMTPAQTARDLHWTQAALDKIMTDDTAFLSAVKAEGGEPLRIDGELGRVTRLAVRAFEKYRRLDVDSGYPGPQVVAELDRIVGAGWQPPV